MDVEDPECKNTDQDVQGVETECKDDENQNEPQSSGKDEISAEQKAINAQKQQQYISNFKPSLRDEQQFCDKLAAKGLVIVSMGEDGNCLFRSICHQVYGTEDYHQLVRQKCVRYLQSEYNYFRSFVPGGNDRVTFDAYCNKMACNGIWGDNLEIQAFSELYGRSISIYAYDDVPMKTFSNESSDKEEEESVPILLSYHCNSHYNSIVSVDEEQRQQTLIGVDKVGQIEEEKIRLSSLRSIEASQASMQLSDMEATELEYYKQALAESRKLFEDHLNQQQGHNQQLDAAIEKSLAQYEKEAVEKAKEESKRQQEEEERRKLERVLHESEFDYVQTTVTKGAMDNEPAQNIENGAVKSLVERGYSLDEATIAYSVFGHQEQQIDAQMLMDRMVDYIEQQRKSQNYYF